MKKLPIYLVLSGLMWAGLALTQQPVVYKDIPPEYLEQAKVIPDFWVSTVDDVFKFLDQRVHKGKVQQIGTTAGGRAMRAVFYGQPGPPKRATRFSTSPSCRDVRPVL